MTSGDEIQTSEASDSLFLPKYKFQRSCTALYYEYSICGFHFVTLSYYFYESKVLQNKLQINLKDARILTLKNVTPSLLYILPNIIHKNIFHQIYLICPILHMLRISELIIEHICIHGNSLCFRVRHKGSTQSISPFGCLYAFPLGT